MPEGDGGDATTPLIALSAALGTRNEASVAAALERAAFSADSAAVDEVLLQSHLFIGFPAVLEAMRLWRERVPGPPAPERAEDAGLWSERGERVCETVYGASYGRLRESVAALHPALDRWMVEGGYGRVIGRPGLSLATRELCIVALLATWGAPRQLHSHLRGALNAGASVTEVERALALAGAFLDRAAKAEIQELWGRIVAAYASSRSTADTR